MSNVKVTGKYRGVWGLFLRFVLLLFVVVSIYIPSTGITYIFRHMVQHSQKCNSTQCFVCGKQMTDITDLTIHLGDHSQQPCSCQWCGQVLIGQEQLEEHLVNHNVMQNSQSTNKIQISSQELISGGLGDANTEYGSMNYVNKPAADACNPELSDVPVVESQEVMNSKSAISLAVSGVVDQNKSTKLPTIKRLQKNLDRPEMKCNICNKRFVNAGNLRRHIEAKAGKPVFSCAECDEKFHDKSALKKHIIAMHVDQFVENPRAHQCPICSSDFTSIQALHKHMIDVHEFVTSKSEKFLSIDYSSIKSETVQEAAMIRRCPSCMESFKDTQSLQEHVLEVHKYDSSAPKHRQIPCPIVEEEVQVLDSSTEVENVSTASEEQQENEQKEARIENLADLLATDNTEKDSNLEADKEATLGALNLSATGGGQLGLKSDVKRVHQTDSPSYSADDSSTRGSQEGISQDAECVFEVDEYGALDLSLKKRPATSVPGPDGNIQPSWFKVPKSEFGEPFDLSSPRVKTSGFQVNANTRQAHEYFRVGTPDLGKGETVSIPSYGGRGFVPTLSKHKGLAGEKLDGDGETKPIEHGCNISSETLHDRSLLPQHMKEHDKNPEQSHDCEYCSEKFSSVDDLKKHLASHVRDWAHFCPYCLKMFCKEEDYNQHITDHVEQSPFRCNACEATFPAKELLDHHFMAEHPGLKPHLCVKCSRRFQYQAYLRSHMRSHMDDKPFKCQYCPRYAPTDQVI